MSELKAFNMPRYAGQFTLHEVYLKSEADKVITDLKAQKAQAEDDCVYWKTMSRKCADDNEVITKQRTEALKRERHHKYKRCLAMAKWSKAGMYLSYECDFKREWWNKWHNRWWKLAEKFKEAK